MKNKVILKKHLLKILITLLIFVICFLSLNIYEYHIYTINFNHKINDIINILEDKYPDLKEEDIIAILNDKSKSNDNTLKEYGIDLNDKSIVIDNSKIYPKFLIINMIFLLIFTFFIILEFIIYLSKRNRDLLDITRYVEELNKRNYSLNIDANSEDELSILRNEIYKTTVMLKETADISRNDKLNLKKSLEDISHQLKTPLTSILVMLDNLIDDPEMDAKTREDFIIDIKRNVININFFVQSILKLSKFDANTIHFTKSLNGLDKIIKEACKNVSTLCDLRNIKINIKGDKEIKVKCDAIWEIEALTNIIKNCVEHSHDHSKIDILYEDNNAYTKVLIRDYGDGISPTELPHIFERFYKGKNSSNDSVGIGLSLAKAIIENDNGIINVESNDEGTTFIIKYLK